MGSVGALLGPNVKTAVIESNEPADRPRALALSAAGFGLGGILGGVFAASFTPWAMRSMGWRFEHARDSLLVLMGCALLLAVPVVVFVDRARRRRRNGEPAAVATRVELHDALRWIAGDHRLRSMALLVVVAGIAESVALYAFYWLVTEQTSAEHGRTMFFAGFHAWLSAATLAMLVFGTNRLVDRIGVVAAIASLPIALAAGTVYLLVSTVVLVLYVLRIVENALAESVYERAVERVFLRIRHERADVIRPVLQGLVGRVGRGLGALLTLALGAGLGVGFRTLLVVYLGTLLVWLAAALTLCRRTAAAS